MLNKTLIVCLIGIIVCSKIKASQNIQPNIILILTDDQGWWELGAHGNTTIETPFLDQFSKESVNFTHYYAAPVCSPTRAGMMTGRYHLRTGLYNTRFGGDVIHTSEITIAELLQKAGYRTALFGKWHLGKYFDYQPNQKGFDEFMGHHSGHIEHYDYPNQLVYNGKPVEGRKYVTDLFTDAAIDFIEAESTSPNPFFCYLAYNAPHSPWVVGTSHARQERGDKLIKKYVDRGLSMKDARIYAMVEIIDENLGRLFRKLDDLGIAENTIVIFSSDNGGVSSHYTAGLRGKKGSVYEGGVRAPLLIRWPNEFKAGTERSAMVSHLDIFPTICEITNINLPEDRKIDGKSLLSLLKEGGSESPHTYLFHHWDRYFPNPYNTWAVSDGRYKLLNSPSPWPKEAVPKPEPFGELYDLIEDPGETRDISELHPDIVQKLRKAFLNYFEDVTANKNYSPIAIPVGKVEENPIEIEASWASINGDNIQYTFLGYDWDSIDSWKDQGEYAEWQLDVEEEGTYEVKISYGSAIQSAGGKLRIKSRDAMLDFEIKSTSSPDIFITTTLGNLVLNQGPETLKAEVVSSEGKELMRLNKIWLKKID